MFSAVPLDTPLYQVAGVVQDSERDLLAAFSFLFSSQCISSHNYFYRLTLAPHPQVLERIGILHKTRLEIATAVREKTLNSPASFRGVPLHKVA